MQIVLAAIGGRIPLAAFEQHHAQTGCGKLLGHHSAARAGAHDHRVYMLEGHAHPAFGGSS